MKAPYLAAGALVILIAAALLLYSALTIRPVAQDDSLKGINLPPGFSISVFADLGSAGLSLPGPNPGPRMMLVKDGVLYVTIPDQGRVLALTDRNGDKKADDGVVFIDGLDRPHGIDYHDGWFYIAEEDKVIRAMDADGDLKADSGSAQELVSLPAGGQHVTRTVKVRDGFMYVSIGSTCNVCHEADAWRAAIIRCRADGSDCAVYARGLRNAVGMAFQPGTGKLFATENGRDLLGDDVPPDEINVIDEGGDYGWPICYGNNIHDTDFDKNVYVRNPCMEPFETPGFIDLQAHSAPLGLMFYNGTAFPEAYRGKLFVAYHGSWNRNVPTGYKIVVIDVEDKTVSDFATGWLGQGSVSGRPVDIAMAGDGSVFVSDDTAGRIYRISYTG
jgi:glucose/arabinose dehydrogenase